MKLTEHFSLEEMTKSSTARAKGIDNSASAEVQATLKNLCEKILEPLRQWYGKPISVSSGYRCPKLNKAVGGVTCSQHMKGEAADIQVYLNVSKSNAKAYNEELRKLFVYIKEHLPFDQVIWERNSKASNTYWIHVSCKVDASKNRKKVINELVKYK